MSGFANPIIGGGGALVYPSIHSPDFNEATQTGWSIDKNGNAFFYGITTSGEFTGTNFIINSAGAFFYSSAPALGNLIASVASTAGKDAHGNAYLAGPASYSPGPFIATAVDRGEIQFWQAPDAGGPYTLYSTVAGTGSGQQVEIAPGLSVLGEVAGLTPLVVSSLVALSAGVPLVSLTGTSAAGPVLAVSGTGASKVTMDGDGDIAAATLALTDASATGGLLSVTNTSSATGNPNVQLTGNGATDNMLGVETGSDSNNRFKVNASGKMQWGPGNTGLDTNLYRTSAGSQLAADTILANISGSAETWHTLGTLAGATVNVGQFRMLADGMIAMEIDITFAASTAVPITFSVTIPAAYRPLNAVDVRTPMAQTNNAGGIARIFVGSAGGANPGMVQIAANANVIGTYSAHFQYPVI